MLLGKDVVELEQLAESVLGEKKFRGKQIYQHLLQGVDSIDSMTSLSKDLRSKLKDGGYMVGRSKVHSRKKASDGTEKLLLELADGQIVECVGIPVDDANKDRLTVCVSSQVGCAMACTFCATGKMGFTRDLTAGEIVDQVFHVQQAFEGSRVSNVVYMGMGEPMMNLKNVVASEQILNKGLGIGARHITVSTVGVPNTIRRLAEHKLQIILAISLHAPNQALRETLIPTAKAYPLEALLQDCVHYFKQTGRRVSFEYILIADVNDSLDDARELARLLQSHGNEMMRSHVNLIPWNAIDDADFKRPSRNRVMAFMRALKREGVSSVSVRRARGAEEGAACGQLRNNLRKARQPGGGLEALASP
ncbi:ribosomal RNA methyltransferase RlmN [Chloropicon roscoffensis]|uniref:Ribosomal RNA methyltransferase RlmN n=1 Tax=Chloropicon roscoffensis TaxID=1461544 RepID=A0AAX4P6P1_9CHLO